MYEVFYGLNSKPFQLNPDPAFYFGSKQHTRAMAYLDYGLHQSQGFIVITGEVGAGKTTIIRNLLGKLDQNKIVAGQLVSTQLGAEDTLRLVGAAFGIPVKNASKSELLMLLEGYFTVAVSNGKRCLLIVDEAQNLSQKAVEELRMLSNFQFDNVSLLQTFLVGQPEFRSILQRPDMSQLKQRVIATCHISPLDQRETQEYIEHRLRCSGYEGAQIFDRASYELIHHASAGVPRRINSLCDRLLLFGYLNGKKRFTAQDVKEVLRELDEENRVRASAPFHELDEGTHAGEDSLGLDLGGLTLDIDSRLVNEGTEVIAALGADQVAESLLRLERGMLRLERINSVMLSLMQQLLQAARRTRGSETDPEASAD
jgi:putative secretion ATPase (PEP-CTERM system associated)